MPWRPPTGIEADSLWVSHKVPVFAAFHAISSVLCFVEATRQQAVPLLGVAGIGHLAALFFCLLRRGTALEALDVAGRQGACISSIAAWALRAVAYYRLSSAPSAITYGSIPAFSIVAEVILSGFEQVHALMLAPGAAVACGLAWHLRLVYTALQQHGVQPSLPVAILWFLVQLALPHLYHWFMYHSLSPHVGRRPMMRDLMRQSAAKAAGANAQCNVVPKDWPAKEPAPSKSNHADGEEAGTRQGPQSAEASGSRKHGEGRAQQGTESQPWAAAKAPSLAGETVTAIPGATSSTIEAADSMQELTAKSWAPVIAEHLQHPNRSREAAQAAAEPAADLAPAAQEQPGMEIVPSLVSLVAARSSAQSMEHMVQEAHLLSNAPRPQVLQALRNTRDLVRRASVRSYSSRLAQPQVIIKLEGSEPGQLRQDVVGNVDSVLHATGHIGFLVSRASARRGCVLLVVDLLMATAEAPVGGFNAVASCAQEWLEALVSPGTHIPDSSLAFLASGGKEVQARWKQDQATWEVGVPSLQSPPPLHLTLLWVEHAVLRLSSTSASAHTDTLAVSTTSASTAGALSSRRYVTLVLRMDATRVRPNFIGSDAHTAVPASAESSSSAGVVDVQCVARGSWGTCPPLAVSAVVIEEEVDSSSSSINDLHTAEDACLVALTLSLDVSAAPHAGLVEIELWNGRTVLAAAPILLLPCLALEAEPSTAAQDCLLEELTTHLSQSSWEVGPVAADARSAAEGTEAKRHQGSISPFAGAPEKQALPQQGPEGIAAWLTDLGQLVHAAECIKSSGIPQPAGRPGSGHLVDVADVMSSSSAQQDAPEHWGGIVASLAWRYAHDPQLLSALLSLAEGLGEYAALEGHQLMHVGALIADAIATIGDRLKQLQAPVLVSLSGQAGGEELAPPATSGSSSSLQQQISRQGLPKSEATSGTSISSAAQSEVRLSGGVSGATTTSPGTSSDCMPSGPPQSQLRRRPPRSSDASARLPLTRNEKLLTDKDSVMGSAASLPNPTYLIPTPDRPAPPTTRMKAARSFSYPPGAAPPATGAGVEADSPQAHPAHSAAADGPAPVFNQHSFRHVAACLLRGFPAAQEQEYATWLAARTSRLSANWCKMMLFWYLASWLRSVQLGLPAMMSYIPINLVMTVPYALSVVLAHQHKYRWAEGALLLHAAGRSAAALLAFFGWLTWQATYANAFKIYMDIWEGLLAAYFAPKRMPVSILCATVMLGFNSLGPWLPLEGALSVPILALRAGACWVVSVAAGAVVDLAHRRTFLRERAFQHTPTSSLLHQQSVTAQ